MANTSYLTLTGANQGAIDGDCPQKGREKSILVYAVDHSIEIPRDTHTGLATGQRIHHPLTITKHKDQASPKLFQACCTGEHLTAWSLKYFRINDKGQEEHYFTIKLSDAIIVNMREYTPLTFLDANKPYKDMEEVSFSYSKISWTYEPAGIESEDNWKAPSAA